MVQRNYTLYIRILCIHDDFCIYGFSERYNVSNHLHFMQVASNSGLVCNSRNCQIKHPEITLYCAIFSKEGIKANPEKIQGITDVQQLLLFLGMLNFMQPYILHLSHHTLPLRELLQKIKYFTGLKT